LAWTIEYSESATKSLQKLDRSIAKRVVNYMEQRIATLPDPRLSGKPLSGGMKGLWRYRVADYRIICRIEDRQVIILVVDVDHRREVYR
jgi:mRNA interferase RelE/StbE